MTAAALLIAVSTLGVKWGWEPVDDGIRYIIQIEPHLVDSFAAGQDILSDLPRSTLPIRGYKITVGTDRLPNEGVLPTPYETGPRFPTAYVPPNDGTSGPTSGSPAPATSIAEAAPTGLTATTALRPTAEPPSPSDVIYSTDSVGSTVSPSLSSPWTATLLVLFASLGVNLYLGLIARGFRNRCIELLAKLKQA
jgi:hypothetical protein